MNQKSSLREVLQFVSRVLTANTVTVTGHLEAGVTLNGTGLRTGLISVVRRGAADAQDAGRHAGVRRFSNRSMLSINPCPRPMDADDRDFPTSDRSQTPMNNSMPPGR
ncbi:MULTISPECIES: hypothetical protein [Rhodopseudomonas]|uniref:hypothetical protein n=1 Tax=Rhodopseudomonas TaxID=1073 RepID=UPI000A8A9015